MDSTKSQPTTCKACGEEIVQSGQRSFGPFCSKRCKMADLGKWFNEEYIVPGQTPPDFELES